MIMTTVYERNPNLSNFKIMVWNGPADTYGPEDFRLFAKTGHIYETDYWEQEDIKVLPGGDYAKSNRQTD